MRHWKVASRPYHSLTRVCQVASRQRGLAAGEAPAFPAGARVSLLFSSSRGPPCYQWLADLTSHSRCERHAGLITKAGLPPAISLSRRLEAYLCLSNCSMNCHMITSGWSFVGSDPPVLFDLSSLTRKMLVPSSGPLRSASCLNVAVFILFRVRPAPAAC
jgi:hypothetical protein